MLRSLRSFYHNKVKKDTIDDTITFYKMFEDFMWVETKTLMDLYVTLPLLVKAEIMGYLVAYPVHLYSLSVDPALSSQDANGLWCDIYKARYGGFPTIPYYNKLNVMSLFFAQTLLQYWRDRRRTHLCAKLAKFSCKLREDSKLCEAWINNEFPKGHKYFYAADVAESTWLTQLIHDVPEYAKKLKANLRSIPKTQSHADIFSRARALTIESIPAAEIENHRSEALAYYETHILKEGNMLVWAPCFTHIKKLNFDEISQSAHDVLEIKHFVGTVTDD